MEPSPLLQSAGFAPPPPPAVTFINGLPGGNFHLSRSGRGSADAAIASERLARRAPGALAQLPYFP